MKTDKDMGRCLADEHQHLCPHGKDLDSEDCAGCESVVGGTKSSHRDRAEKFYRLRYDDGSDYHKKRITQLETAFAQVEEEAKDEVCAEPESYGLARTGYVKVKEAGPWVKIPNLKGFKRVDSFFGATAGPLQQIAPGGIMAKLMAEAEDGGREAVVPLSASCTCGASSVGSRIHSDYCDCA